MNVFRVTKLTVLQITIKLQGNLKQVIMNQGVS